MKYIRSLQYFSVHFNACAWSTWAKADEEKKKKGDSETHSLMKAWHASLKLPLLFPTMSWDPHWEEFVVSLIQSGWVKTGQVEQKSTSERESTGRAEKAHTQQEVRRHVCARTRAHTHTLTHIHSHTHIWYSFYSKVGLMFWRSHQVSWSEDMHHGRISAITPLCVG